MSEELPEPAAVDPAPLDEQTDGGGGTDAPAVQPATDPPGDKIYVCPACGTRYDEPTTCSNGHAATQTVEYDRATFEAAAAGDADAIASVNETAASAAGPAAGIAPAEATPPGAVPVPADPVAAPVDPTPTVTPDGIGGTPAAAATPSGTDENVAAIGAAIAQLEAALSAAKTALGIGA